MATKIRVYAFNGKKYDGTADQYSLYFPIPKSKREGIVGFYIPFNFVNGQIYTCDSGEVREGIGKDVYLGKKMDIASLPEYVRKWVYNYETAFQHTLELNTDEAWNEFNKM